MNSIASHLGLLSRECLLNRQVVVRLINLTTLFKVRTVSCLSERVFLVELLCFALIHACISFRLLVGRKSDGVNTIGAGKVFCAGWVNLNVFPA